MSCERNRRLFFGHLVQTTDGLVRLFGSPGVAEAACEQIFQAGRNAAIEPTVMQSHSADLRPPTHARQGLPKKDAQRGYQAIWETIQAVRQQRLLLAIAEQVRQFQVLRALEPRPEHWQPFQRGEIPIGRNGAVPANHLQDGFLLTGDRVVMVQTDSGSQPVLRPCVGRLPKPRRLVSGW